VRGSPTQAYRSDRETWIFRPGSKAATARPLGRAVHGVLQTINLSDGGGLEEALTAQCEAEAVPDRIG